MKMTVQKVDWQPTRKILRDYEDFAQESFLAGMSSYADKKCNSAIIGEALFYGYERADDVLDKICEKLDGQVKTHAEIRHIVRIHFFLFGVYKCFLTRTSGKLRKEAPEHVW